MNCCLSNNFSSKKSYWGKCLSGLWSLAVIPIVFCRDNIQAMNAINLRGPWENWFLSRHLGDNAMLPESWTTLGMTGGPAAGNDDKCHIMTTVHWYLGIVAHTSQLSFYQDSLLDTCSWCLSNNSHTFLLSGPMGRQREDVAINSMSSHGFIINLQQEWHWFSNSLTESIDRNNNMLTNWSPDFAYM